jgi:hypothetical protein
VSFCQSSAVLWVLLSCHETYMHAHILWIWVSIVCCLESLHSCTGLIRLQLQVHGWGEFKEDLNCSCRSGPHSSSNIQAGQILQFVQFGSVCFKVYLKSPYCGSIGNCESYNHGVYPLQHLWSQSEVIPNVPLQIVKAL